MKKRKIWLLIVAIAILTVFVLAPSSTYATSSLHGIGLESRKLGKYYYKQIRDTQSGEVNLYASKKRDKGYKKILSSVFCYCGNIGCAADGKFIFTVRNLRDGRQALVRYSSLGRNRKVVVVLPDGKEENDYHWALTAAYGNDIYLSYGSIWEWKVCTYRYNLKTKKMRQVKDDCFIVDQTGSYVVVIKDYKSEDDLDDSTIYKIASGKLKVVKKIGHTSDVAFAGGNLFYVKDTRKNALIYRSKPNGKNPVKIGKIKKPDPYYLAHPFDYKKSSCKIWLNNKLYLYSFKKKKMIFIKSWSE